MTIKQNYPNFHVSEIVFSRCSRLKEDRDEIKPRDAARSAAAADTFRLQPHCTRRFLSFACLHARDAYISGNPWHRRAMHQRIADLKGKYAFSGPFVTSDSTSPSSVMSDGNNATAHSASDESPLTAGRHFKRNLYVFCRYKSQVTVALPRVDDLRSTCAVTSLSADRVNHWSDVVSSHAFFMHLHMRDYSIGSFCIWKIYRLLSNDWQRQTAFRTVCTSDVHGWLQGIMPIVNFHYV